MLARLFAATTALLLSLAAQAEAPPKGGRSLWRQRGCLSQGRFQTCSGGVEARGRSCLK